MHEFLHVLRGLARTPRRALVPAITLAFALGGSGSLLTLYNALMMRELVVPHPDRLVAVYPALGEALLGIREPTLVQLRDRQRVVTGLCGVSRGALEIEIRGIVALRRNDGVTGNCYETLGIRAHLGRLLDERDAPDFGDPAAVVVIGYRFWTEAFDRHPRVIGQTLRAHGVPLTIVGVTPPTFDGIDVEQGAEVTIPLRLTAKLRGASPDAAVALRSIGRLEEGMTLDQGRAHLRAVWPDTWASTNPPRPGQSSSAGTSEALRIESLAKGLSVQRNLYGSALTMLVALTGMLLLLSYFSIAALFLARAVARDGEFAVRRAVGASRMRLAMLVTGEAAIVGTAATIIAVPIAWWASRLLAATMWTRSTPTTMDVTPGVLVFGAIAAAGLGGGLLCSIPATIFLWFRRRSLSGNYESRTVISGTGSWQKSLIVAQFGLSFVLLFCATLFVGNVIAIRSIDPGYNVNGLRWTRLELAFGQPRSIDHAAYFRPMLERIRTLPGVSGAALSVGFPTTELRHVAALVPFIRADRESDGRSVSGTIGYVSPDFFSVVGIPLLQGREFAWTDGSNTSRIAIINRTLASRLFPDGNAVGAALISPETAAGLTFTIGGVVEDSSPGDVRIRSIPIVYLPLLQNPGLMAAPTLIVRGGEVRGFAGQLGNLVEQAGRHRIADFQTIPEQLNRFVARERVLATLSLALAALSVLIASLGLYALLAEEVLRRRRDVSVRVALGATYSMMASAIIRRGVVLAGIGISLTLPIAIAAERSSRPLLLEAVPPNTFTLPLAAIAVLAIGVIASAWPAWRVVRIAPGEALRYE